jgi:hypothetical protein
MFFFLKKNSTTLKLPGQDISFLSLFPSYLIVRYLGLTLRVMQAKGERWGLKSLAFCIPERSSIRDFEGSSSGTREYHCPRIDIE